jgi:predicted AlkP superfamily pyrophosphatase or phosphodiesterase
MSKLLVFCLDALCSLDLETMKTLPNLGWVIANGSYVRHAEPVYPSLTYPCHVSILTGNFVDKHGVPHNEKVKAGQPDQPWYNQRTDVKCATLLDLAKKNGYRTCSISWPVTGGADFDLNMPMIIPMGYSGPEPIQYLVHNATDELLERYYPQYAHFLIGKDRSLDKYTMALSLDILRDYRQPDVMLIKMCDLDSVRHVSGVDNENVRDQLKVHDAQFGLILDQIRSQGNLENTNFVILGDHGQSNITQGINLNILLKQQGFIRLDDEGKVADYDAYCHSASLSAWIQLKEPGNIPIRNKVYEFLVRLTEDPKSGIGHIFTSQEAESRFHLRGPFDFIIEGREPIAFSSTLKGDTVFGMPEYPGYSTLAASHGGLPFKNETTTFIACGPEVKRNVVVERRSIVDEAPTMARMLGFDMPDVDGKPILEMVG